MITVRDLKSFVPEFIYNKARDQDKTTLMILGNKIKFRKNFFQG